MQKLQYLFEAVMAITIVFTIGGPQQSMAAEMDHQNMGGHHHESGQGHMAQMEQNKIKLQKRLGNEYDKKIPQGSTLNINKGKEIYKNNCTSCHGVNGKGDGPVSKGLNPPAGDFTDPMHANFYSDRARLEIIRSGSEGTAMPAWSQTLSKTEQMNVFQYIRSLRTAGTSKSMDHKMMQGEHAQAAPMAMANHMMREKNGIQIMLMLNPSPVQSNQKTAVDLSFTEANTQKGAKAEKVTVSLFMPGHNNHLVETKNARPQRTQGSFKTSFAIPMDGAYEARISAIVQGKQLTTRFLFLVGNALPEEPMRMPASKKMSPSQPGNSGGHSH